MAAKKRIHVTLPSPLIEAAEALADLEGRAVSELLEELIRDHLRQRGLLIQPTAAQIQAHLKRKKK